VFKLSPEVHLYMTLRKFNYQWPWPIKVTGQFQRFVHFCLSSR